MTAAGEHGGAGAPPAGAEEGTVPWRALLAEAAATLAAGGIEGAEVEARRIVEEHG